MDVFNAFYNIRKIWRCIFVLIYWTLQINRTEMQNEKNMNCFHWITVNLTIDEIMKGIKQMHKILFLIALISKIQISILKVLYHI